MPARATLSAFFLPTLLLAQAPEATPALRICTDEAEAVLAILHVRQEGRVPAEAQWQTLFATEGYRRLKERELSMNRPFEEAAFREFVLSADMLKRAPALKDALKTWRQVDFQSSARKVSGYLPPGARIRAAVHFVIKPRTNSFVFDLGRDPAVFFYLDPEVSPAKLENTVAHELHHVGLHGALNAKGPWAAKSDAPLARAREYVGAFGEGFAMLAAAGGTKVHPHAVSSAAERARWDQDAGRFASDLRDVETFLKDVACGRLGAKEARDKAMATFWGEQGAWYTVGYRVAALIEDGFGRQRLIECMEDLSRLLSTYNEAARLHSPGSKEPLPLWSEELLGVLQGRSALGEAPQPITTSATDPLKTGLFPDQGPKTPVPMPAISSRTSQVPVRPVRVLFLEPAVPPPSKDESAYRIVSEPSRVKTWESWMANESARMALDLYAEAWALTPQGRRGEPPIYYVALVPGGNHAAVGLRLAGDSSPDAHAHTPYILLEPNDWAFTTTFLHETGHVILSLLNEGREIPKREIAAFSHATAALTDRGTAFDEGFAIHLETLAAHLTTDPFLRDRYHHLSFRFGASDMQGEFHRHAGDLLSFSQTLARYPEVRENHFAFAPAYAGPDYLRVQLEKSRDFSTLRDANQLLQSEGFYASFFFAILVRGKGLPALQVLHDRQQQMLAALADMLGPSTQTSEDPFLLRFLESYRRLFPQHAAEVLEVFLDLSHGVFVDPEAAEMWRRHYLGALRLDRNERDNPVIENARRRWRTELVQNLQPLDRCLAPQLRVEVPGRTVRLLAFQEAHPLSFDLNTAEIGVLRLIPGISEAEVGTWMRHRSEKAFTGAKDFRARAGLKKATLAHLRFK